MKRKRTGREKNRIRRTNRVRDSIEVEDLDEIPGKPVISGRREGDSGVRVPASGRRSRSSGRNREFAIITYLFLAMFLAMIAYFVYYQAFQSESTINSPYNTRQDLYAKRVIRGDILSSDGKVLATTEIDDDGGESRVYPYDRMYAHAVGFVNNGKGGIESQYNFNLLRSHSFFLTQILNDLRDRKNRGDAVVTTLDSRIQKAAYDALGNRDGAITVLEAETGKVLAMVSKPDFDPNTLEEKWDDIVSDEDSSVLLNRVTSGLYPPGSVFKIFTALEYIHENDDYGKYTFDCRGKLGEGKNEIHCYHNTVHGKEDLSGSFADSCNTSFANIGLTLDVKSLRELCEEMLFNQSLPGRVAGAKSRFSLKSGDDDWKVMQTAIGQGDTLVTPLHMAMVAAAIANEGEAMAPFLVQGVENDGGISVKKYRSASAGQIMNREDAERMRGLMEQVVAEGTATALDGQDYYAAGKTGSAEYNSKGDSHGWFVGFASREGGPTVAIAVVIEDGDSGSRTAVPAAKKVFDACFPD